MSGISLACCLHIENKFILTRSWWDSISIANARLTVLRVPAQLSFLSILLSKAVM